MDDISFDCSQWRERLVLRQSARARSVRLRVHVDGRVVLTMPRGFNQKLVPGLLEQHESWVVKTLQRLDAEAVLKRAEPPSVIEMAALGCSWNVEYLDDDGGRYGCRESGDGHLLVSGGLHWQQALRRWLLRQGRQHLLPWLHQVSKEVGLGYHSAGVRLQRSRWGSCSPRQRISLNAGLLFLAPELVRYLFVHELCHTRQMNHSAQYWRLVESLEPQYREREKALRAMAREVPVWVHHINPVPVMLPGHGNGL